MCTQNQENECLTKKAVFVESCSATVVTRVCYKSKQKAAIQNKFPVDSIECNSKESNGSCT